MLIRKFSRVFLLSFTWMASTYKDTRILCSYYCEWDDDSSVVTKSRFNCQQSIAISCQERCSGKDKKLLKSMNCRLNWMKMDSRRKKKKRQIKVNKRRTSVSNKPAYNNVLLWCCQLLVSSEIKIESVCGI